MHYGERLGELLQIKGMSNEAFAAAYGCSPQRVGQMIKNKHFNTETLEKIAETLGIAIGEFFTKSTEVFTQKETPAPGMGEGLKPDIYEMLSYLTGKVEKLEDRIIEMGNASEVEKIKRLARDMQKDIDKDRKDPLYKIRFLLQPQADKPISSKPTSPSSSRQSSDT